MKATLILADYAEVVDGKVYVCGGGWEFIGPQPTPFALLILIKIPWDLANRKIPWQLKLMTEDGHPAMLPTPMGEQAFELAGELEVGRPPGIKPGSLLQAPLAIKFGPLPLEPGKRFVWVLSLDGKEQEDWRVTFDVRKK